MGTLTPKHKSDHDIFIGTDKALFIPNLDSYNNITYLRQLIFNRYQFFSINCGIMNQFDNKIKLSEYNDYALNSVELDLSKS